MEVDCRFFDDDAVDLDNDGVENDIDPVLGFGADDDDDDDNDDDDDDGTGLEGEIATRTFCSDADD